MPEPLTDFDDMRRYSNLLRRQSEKRIGALADRLIDREITLSQWQDNMKAELRRGNLEQFLTANGGTSEGIRRTDYLKLGPEHRRQYSFLRKFTNTIETAIDDDKPLDFVRARSKLYATSTQGTFWRAAVPVTLPQVPRDGRTQCKTNCHCRLEFTNERDSDGLLVAVLVRWRLGIADHCPDCLRLSRTWNPLRIEVDGDTTSSIQQAIELTLAGIPGLRDSALDHARTLLYEALEVT